MVGDKTLGSRRGAGLPRCSCFYDRRLSLVLFLEGTFDWEDRFVALGEITGE